MILTGTELAHRQTIEEMVATYQACIARLQEAERTVEECTNLLRAAFQDTDGHRFCMRIEYDHYDRRRNSIIRLKKDAWEAIITRLELRKVLTVKRLDELNKKMENQDDLPEITVDNVLAFFRDTVASADLLMKDLAAEVLQILKPRRNDYKTNSHFRVGERVILSGMVEWSVYGRRFKANCYREHDLGAIDKIFRLLDGKGVPPTYRGELMLEIDKGAGSGETEYFKYKCYGNRNLHLQFKRMDLVKKLNQMTVGNLLDK